MLSTRFIIQKLSLIPPGCSAGIWAGMLFNKWYEYRSISKHREIMDSLREEHWRLNNLIWEEQQRFNDLIWKKEMEKWMPRTNNFGDAVGV